jgi:hypothetical protein
MKRGRRREQRQHPRFQLRTALRGRTLPPLGILQGEGESAFGGRIQNIGAGGICLLSDRPIPVASVVRCEIVLPKTSAGIPTLMQVRWVDAASNQIGLQFLL